MYFTVTVKAELLRETTFKGMIKLEFVVLISLAVSWVGSRVPE